MVAIVWTVDVRPGFTEQFEKLYGADGEWTQLSRRSRSFLGSSFLRDIAASHRYVLVEYWSEMVIYEKHVTNHARQLHALEQQRDGLVERIETLGVFQALDVPARAGPTWSRRSGA
jgi:quinol monooxygenase YgiN